jgi:hypothetical protein
VQSGRVSITENTVRWNLTGSLIRGCQCKHNDDLDKYQGLEKHVLGIDEAPQLKEEHIRGLLGWVRMPSTMTDLLPDQLADLYPHIKREDRKHLFPRVIYTGNPLGPSKNFFRRNFVKARPPRTIERTEDKHGGFLRQFIPSFVSDNPYADPVAQRRRLSAMGEDVADALITGNWDTIAGQFYDMWDTSRHVVPDFMPPDWWFKFRTMDLGYREPTVVHWWAVSDGEEFRDGKGRKRWFPRGSLICYREWNIADPEEPSLGLALRNEEIAQGILSRTEEQISDITVTDSLPFQDRGMGSSSKKYRIADVFADAGVPLVQGNTAIIHGCAQVRDRLIGRAGFPLLYFCQCCVAACTYMPMIGRSETHPEKTEEDGECTHACDSTRYACTTRPITIDRPSEDAPRRKGMSETPKQILERLSYDENHYKELY